MTYRIENKDLIIDGWEKGISDDPYSGISDMRGMNIISIPGEASVNFATVKASQDTITTATVTSADAALDRVYYTGGTNLATGVAITFTGGSLPTGITAGKVYWVYVIYPGAIHLYNNPGVSSLVDITATGTGTFDAVVMSTPNAWSNEARYGTSWMVDTAGRVWTDAFAGNRTVVSGVTWTYAGNTTLTNAHGNGIATYIRSDSSGSLDADIYIFVFRNGLIDYTTYSTVSNTGWIYGWNPADQTTGNTTNSLNSLNGQSYPHTTLLGPSKTLYYCDASFVGSWYEKANQIFDPLNAATYTFTKQAIQTEQNDINQSIALLGNNLLVGGVYSDVYVWDRTSLVYQYRIRLAEQDIKRIEVINTTAYIFTGNRGRIYKSNGSQATLYKKVPDHLANTVEPYYTWGGAASNKNQLYFGVSATKNDASTAVTTYGGLWAIDTDTDAMRMVNQLSYATYAGSAKVIIPRLSSSVLGLSNTTGASLYICWDNGASGYGVDQGLSTPYTTYVAYVDSEMIPIATILRKKTFEQLEFKLTVPLVSGEGVKISYRTNITEAYTQVGETTTVGALSDLYTNTFENVQWIQLRTETKSTASSPSFTRLKEIRIR